MDFHEGDVVKYDDPTCFEWCSGMTGTVVRLNRNNSVLVKFEDYKGRQGHGSNNNQWWINKSFLKHSGGPW